MPSLIGGRRSRTSTTEQLEQQQAHAKAAIPDYEKAGRSRSEDVVSNRAMVLLPARRNTAIVPTAFGRMRARSSAMAETNRNRNSLISERNARIQQKARFQQRVQQLRQTLRGLNGITSCTNWETLLEQSIPLDEGGRNLDLPPRNERHCGSAIGDGKVGHGG